MYSRWYIYLFYNFSWIPYLWSTTQACDMGLNNYNSNPLSLDIRKLPINCIRCRPIKKIVEITKTSLFPLKSEIYGKYIYIFFLHRKRKWRRLKNSLEITHPYSTPQNFFFLQECEIISKTSHRRTTTRAKQTCYYLSYLGSINWLEYF